MTNSIKVYSTIITEFPLKTYPAYMVEILCNNSRLLLTSTSFFPLFFPLLSPQLCLRLFPILSHSLISPFCLLSLNILYTLLYFLPYSYPLLFFSFPAVFFLFPRPHPLHRTYCSPQNTRKYFISSLLFFLLLPNLCVLFAAAASS